MFKLFVGLFVFALGGVAAIPAEIVGASASAAAPSIVIVDGIPRVVSGGGLSVHVPRDTATPPGFNITSIGVNGSGCPAGTAYYSLSPDGSSVKITYSNFYAAVGPGIPISSNRRNCQVTLGTRIPSGYSYGIPYVESSGFYSLDAGVTAVQQSIYYFQGSTDQATARRVLKGPLSGAFYTFHDDFDFSDTVVSPCGGATVVNLASSLQVSNKTGTGYIADNSASLDTSFKLNFGFKWSTCY